MHVVRLNICVLCVLTFACVIQCKFKKKSKIKIYYKLRMLYIIICILNIIQEMFLFKPALFHFEDLLRRGSKRRALQHKIQGCLASTRAHRSERYWQAAIGIPSKCVTRRRRTRAAPRSPHTEKREHGAPHLADAFLP